MVTETETYLYAVSYDDFHNPERLVRSAVDSAKVEELVGGKWIGKPSLWRVTPKIGESNGWLLLTDRSFVGIAQDDALVLEEKWSAKYESK